MDPKGRGDATDPGSRAGMTASSVGGTPSDCRDSSREPDTDNAVLSPRRSCSEPRPAILVAAPTSTRRSADAGVLPFGIEGSTVETVARFSSSVCPPHSRGLAVSCNAACASILPDRSSGTNRPGACLPGWADSRYIRAFCTKNPRKPTGVVGLPPIRPRATLTIHIRSRLRLKTLTSRLADSYRALAKALVGTGRGTAPRSDRGGRRPGGRLGTAEPVAPESILVITEGTSHVGPNTDLAPGA